MKFVSNFDIMQELGTLKEPVTAGSPVPVGTGLLTLARAYSGQDHQP